MRLSTKGRYAVMAMVDLAQHSAGDPISLAEIADNFLVIAWTDVEKKKLRDPAGLSAFIVERRFKGFSSGPMAEKWGILAGNTGWFALDDVEVPEENLVGRPGEESAQNGD